MPRHVFLVAVLLACMSGAAVRANDAAGLPGESRTTATRLAEVRKKIDDKKYVEAIDGLQAILESAGNDLVPLTPQRCVQARRLCHRELAKLPPEALLEYRSRVEPQAKKWLDEATPTRDRRLLRRVVDEAFCSRSGETAVDLLGDLAFERGHFDEAIAWWSLLAPSLDTKKDGRDEAALVYPDVQGDKARLYAKQIVAWFFAGATEKATRELKAFQKAYPNAEGELTGHKGKYADLLADLLKQAPPTDPDKTWTTFGGDATRGLVLPAPQRWLERLAFTVKEGPTWRFDLEKRTLLDDTPLPAPGRGKPASERARSLAFHPLICGHYVVVSDAQYVTAYDLRTGKATPWFDVAELNLLEKPNLKLPVPTGQRPDEPDLRDLRYTLTAADGCVYVRLGAQNVFHPDDIDGNDPDGAKAKKRDEKIASFIACLSLEPATERKRARWCMRPMVVPGKPEWEQRGAIFEGTPIVHNGLLYAAVTWFEGDRTVTALQCYPAGTETLPQKRWQQTVCETRELKSKEQRPRHHLLTVAGPNVVYCSHSGAIVAVDALTGKTAWAVRYPSQPPTNADEPSLRDLTPCVYAAGRLYAAPADYDHLLCLDPLTGETLWDREHIAATHLLGVGQGRLIFTTLAELHAVNAADGGYTDGWFLPDGGGKMPPMGRGFLSGDVVVWPAVSDDGDHVFVRRQEDGAPAEIDELKRVPAGNLVYSDGVLAVADRTTLSVFVPPALRLDERREQVKKNPNSPVDRLLLARAELDAAIQNDDSERVEKEVRGLIDFYLSKIPHSLEGPTNRELSNAVFEMALRHEDATRFMRRLELVCLSQTQRDAVKIQRAKMYEAKGQLYEAIQQWRFIVDNNKQSDDLIDEDGVPRCPRYIAQQNLARQGIFPDMAPEPVFVPRSAPTGVDDTRNWSLPWERSEERRLAPGARLLSVPSFETGLLVTGASGGVTFYPHDAESKRWNCLLEFRPTMGWIDGQRLILAASEGLTALNTRDQKVIWSAGRRGANNFQFAGGRVFFLENEERLFAVDAATGNTLWAKWAIGAKLNLKAPLGHFHPQITPIGTALLVQPTPGRLWLLDAATGKRLHEESNRYEPWPRAPFLVDDNTALLVLDSRTIVLFDGVNGKTIWKHTIPQSFTLTGEAPQLVVDGGNILLLTPNNLGCTLQRLDRATGKPLWEVAPLLEPKAPLDTAGWSLDKTAVYYVQDQVLTARSLADGTILWRQALAAANGPWRTRRIGDAVVAYPTETGGRRFQFRWQMFSVQWEMNHSREVGVGHGLPVSCCDAKSGRLVQRLNLLAGPPHIRTRLDFAASSRPDTALQMLLMRSEIVLAIDSTVWRYTPTRVNAP